MAFIYYVTQIQFEFGAVKLLKQECERVGITRPLIVTDPGVKAAGVLQKALDSSRTRYPKAHIMGFDTLPFLKAEMDKARAQGKNVTEACHPGGLNLTQFEERTVCPNPDDHLFWDDNHPTAEANRILGQELPLHDMAHLLECLRVDDRSQLQQALLDDLLELRLGSLLDHVLGAGTGKQRVQHQRGDYAENDGTRERCHGKLDRLEFHEGSTRKRTSAVVYRPGLEAP